MKLATTASSVHKRIKKHTATGTECVHVKTGWRAVGRKFGLVGCLKMVLDRI